MSRIIKHFEIEARVVLRVAASGYGDAEEIARNTPLSQWLDSGGNLKIKVLKEVKN